MLLCMYMESCFKIYLIDIAVQLLKFPYYQTFKNYAMRVTSSVSCIKGLCDDISNIY